MMDVSKNRIVCYSCNKALEHDIGEKVFRNEECPHCQAYIRCCRMCKFYDTSSYNECKEPVAERILEKEKPNFCEFFKISGSGDGQDDKNSLLDAANSLFKN